MQVQVSHRVARRLRLSTLLGQQEFLPLCIGTTYYELMERSFQLMNAGGDQWIDILCVSVAFEGKRGIIYCDAISEFSRCFNDLICLDVPDGSEDVHCMVRYADAPAFIAFYICQEEWHGSKCMTAVALHSSSTHGGVVCLSCGASYMDEFGTLVRIHSDYGTRYYKAGPPPDYRYRDIIADLPVYVDVPDPDASPSDVLRTDVLQVSTQHSGGVFRVSENVFDLLPVYDWHPLMLAIEHLL